MIGGNSIEIEFFWVGTEENKNKSPAKFSMKVDEVEYFTKTEDIAPNLENRRRLYIPTRTNYPAWDIIYDDEENTAFFSLSISHFWEGHDEKTIESFKNGKLLS